MRRNTLLLAFALAVCTAWAAAQMPGGSMGQQRPVPNDWPSAQQDKDSGQQRSDRDRDRDRDQDRDQDHNRAKDRDHDRNKQKAKVDDATLQREVHEQLASRGEFANVTVNVKDGIVRLDGSVPRKEDRKEAKKLAKSVPGVRSVREKLTIGAAAGAAASSTTGAANTGGVSGAATGSSGTTGSMTGQSSAGAIGQSSTSQTSSAGSASSQPDTQTQMAIQNDLRNNSTLVQNNVVNNINVTATTNNIVISGTVPNQQTAEQVLAIAKARAGARQVVNNLTVSAAAASGAMSGQTGSTAGTTGSMTGQSSAGAIGQSSTSQTGTAGGASSQPDTQTQMAIQNDLRNNSTLVQNNVVNNINVTATTNNIVISGSVPDQQTAEQVLAIAKAHAGARQVVNNLTVSAGAASGAMSGQTGSTAGTTGSMTGQAGTSTSGRTGTTGAIGAQAGTAQGQTGGLTTERNDLVGQIQTALRNEPTLANDNIVVNITDDTVELSGTVATGKEKQTAKRIAESFAANRRVVDRITVTGRGRNENPGKGNQGNVPPPQQ